MPNLLNLLPPELIPFITKHLPIQDLKNCCSLDDIWKAEAIREIRKRLIVDCTFVDKNTTVKALIDPKSQHGSISKTLAKKMDLYITRMYGSKYPAVIDLGIGATNAGKKVMRRGWIDREKVSVTLPNIFDDIVPPSYLGIDTANFVVVDKPEYDLVLGHVCQYRTRNDIWELPLSLHTFYELLFPKFIAMESDGEAIITKFSKHKRDFDGLNEYYDSEYSETDISKTLAKKMDLYITRMYGSKYPAVIDLGIGATNAGKKVMRRGWIDREKVSVTLPNIFDDIVPPSYLGIDTANFVVVDKPEYDLVLGHVWLMHTGY
ncbi:7578_t:CDS:2 [Entrophospora sp. SA101]|nr:7578_t:CDS:2 [Entrophospora sp. SA101]